jgi:predicted DNA-binding transcriptional regulator YafY
MKGGLAVLRKVLTSLPGGRANQGIRGEDLSRQTGISVEEIVTELPQLVNLCGVPPYSPADLVDLEIEGDRVRIHFADQFRRPVRLTLPEALALDMALAGWEEEEEGPFAAAVTGIRAKVRGALSPDVAESVGEAAKRISSVSGPGRAGQMVARLSDAMSRQVEVRIEYFSKRSGRLAARTIRPYGVFEQRGHWYVVAFDDSRDEIRTFRADRIREAESTGVDYEIPDEFEVGRYRRSGPPEPEEPAVEAEIRFDAEVARFVRDGFPASAIEEHEGGGVTATVRASGTAWLVSELLKWGAAAEVVGPDELRDALRGAAEQALARYGR